MCRKRWLFLFSLVLFCVVAIGSPVSRAEDTPVAPCADENPYEDALDCDFVTAITVIGTVVDEDGFEYKAGARGSGFVFVDGERPYIFVGSAWHVQGGFKKIDSIKVTFRVKGKEFTKNAHVVALDDDEHRDVMILAMDDPKFKFTGKVGVLGSSLSVIPNDAVTAIGNPGDHRFVRSSGIVYSTAYRIQGIPYFFISHGAKIEPGSSGGPLCNADGEIIGVNVRYNPKTGDSLAMPIDRVKEVINQIKRQRAKGKSGAGK